MKSGPDERQILVDIIPVYNCGIARMSCSDAAAGLRQAIRIRAVHNLRAQPGLTPEITRKHI